jgi:hypothetical protein
MPMSKMADLKNWSSSIPDDWTTIDSGISLIKTSYFVKIGNSAAEVTVNTSTQGLMELRQAVSVT